MSGESRSLTRREVVGLAIGASLVPLNSTMIAVALPDIADDFDIAVGSTGVLVTIYLVVMLVGQPTMGRIVDKVGSRTALRSSLVGFVAASVATAFAGSLALLIVGRAVQAVFGAALMPASQALLRSLTPPERRGRSFGLLGSFIGAGAAAGPVIGGLVIQLAGWPGIFLVNAPVAGVALAALRTIPSPVVAASEGDSDSSGSPGLSRVITQPTFLASFATQASTTLAQYSLLLVVPIALDARGWSAGEIGLALTSLTVGMVVMGPLGGRAGDVRGRRWPVTVGVGAGAVAMVWAAWVIESSPAALIVAMALFGVGLGFAIPSVQAAALESVPERLAGSAAGVLSVSRYTGSIPASILLTVLVSETGSGSADLLWIGSASMILALAASSRLPSSRSTGH